MGRLSDHLLARTVHSRRRALRPPQVSESRGSPDWSHLGRTWFIVLEEQRAVTGLGIPAVPSLVRGAPLGVSPASCSGQICPAPQSLLVDAPSRGGYHLFQMLDI